MEWYLKHLLFSNVNYLGQEEGTVSGEVRDKRSISTKRTDKGQRGKVRIY